MIKINKNIYKQLKKYEMYLRQAKHCYLMNCSSKTILDVLEIVRKCGYVGSVNVACSNCKLKFLQEIAKPYFEYQISLEKKGDN